MDPVTRVAGRAVPLDRSDVDTDQIIPARGMKRVERTGYAAGLFEKWRRDPAFVLNDPAYRSAPILVSGPNFGCGSSREHAPWALRDHGFRAIIAPGFADIFRGNLPNSGLVPVQAAPAVVAALLAAVTADPATRPSPPTSAPARPGCRPAAPGIERVRNGGSQPGVLAEPMIASVRPPGRARRAGVP